MKKVLASSVVVLMVLFLSAGFGLAGNGQGSGNGAGNGQGGGNGNGDGIGPIHEILEGTPFTYTGTVLTIVVGGGVEIATEAVDENGEPIIVIVTIYGIGPVRYWDFLGVDRLLVEDTITVSGYNVIYSTDTEGTEVSRNIAVTIITVEGVIVELRDPETGLPLWRGSGGNSK